MFQDFPKDTRNEVVYSEVTRDGDLNKYTETVTHWFTDEAKTDYVQFHTHTIVAEEARDPETTIATAQDEIDWANGN